jgi:hypothetical protein
MIVRKKHILTFLTIGGILGVLGIVGVRWLKKFKDRSFWDPTEDSF